MFNKFSDPCRVELFFLEILRDLHALAGTYIPKFKSFFKEGGNVDLSYKLLMADVSYTRIVGRYRMSLGGRYQYMNLFQESDEDTNHFESNIYERS